MLNQLLTHMGTDKKIGQCFVSQLHKKWTTEKIVEYDVRWYVSQEIEGPCESIIAYETRWLILEKIEKEFKNG